MTLDPERCLIDFMRLAHVTSRGATQSQSVFDFRAIVTAVDRDNGDSGGLTTEQFKG